MYCSPPNLETWLRARWSINSGKMESRRGGFPGWGRLRAAASSSGLKSSEILWTLGVGIFLRSDSSLLTSLVDSRIARRWSLPRRARGASRPASKFVDGSPRLAARVRDVDGICSVLPSLLFFLPSRDSRDEAALSESVPTGVGWRSLALFVPAWHIILSTATWDTLFGRE